MSDLRLVDGIGLWLERLGPLPAPGRPALFLDRDGVIVEECHYLGRAQDVRIIDGAATAIRTINEAGLPVVVVTNQAGLGRGRYDWFGFEAVQNELYARLACLGARIDLAVACAYHEEGLGKFSHRDHSWRKPQPGMLLAAAKTFAINMPRSLIVGDRISDLEAGRNAAVGFGTLVETGYGRDECVRLAEATMAPMSVSVAFNIGEAVKQALALGWPG